MNDCLLHRAETVGLGRYEWAGPFVYLMVVLSKALSVCISKQEHTFSLIIICVILMNS